VSKTYTFLEFKKDKNEGFKMINIQWKVWGKSLFLITSVLLLSKLIILRVFIFQEIQMIHLAYDLATVVALTAMIELIVPLRLKKYVYWDLNLLVSFILFASTLYFQHFGSVATYTTLQQLHQLTQIKSSVKSTIEPVDFIYFIDFIIAIPLSFYLKKRKGHPVQARSLWKPSIAVMAFLCLGLSYFSIKGGQPITNELKRVETQGFLNYQADVIWNGVKENPTAATMSLADAKAQIHEVKANAPHKEPLATQKPPQLFGSQKGKNLIVVQLEAFQNFPIHLSVNGQQITPVLNKLADESYYFPHIFQQIGQGNTSDAEFMSNTSIYPTGTVAMSTGFGDRALPSLPRLLQNMNYEADTFHVNDVSFWDRIKLYPALNFDHYYDKPFYENDHFNSFGASDENLYKEGTKILTGLQAKNKPFYAQFVTVSSHFPFTMPEERKRITVQDSIKGTQLDDYITAINYTDYALGTFIDQLKASGLWDNTIFVAYGDHFGLQPQDNDPKTTGDALGIKYDPYISKMNIPLFIHVPGQSQGQVVNQVGGQLDIMPTIANLMGISLKDNKFVHFGHDLLNITHNVLGERYYMPTGSFFNDEIMFVPGKGFDDGTATSLETFQPVTDIEKYRADYDYIMKLEQSSDEYVKALPKR
jgi:lipoteichoic acid synthase